MLPVKEDLALDSGQNGYSEMIRLIKGGIGAMHRGYFSATTVIFLWMQLKKVSPEWAYSEIFQPQQSFSYGCS